MTVLFVMILFVCVLWPISMVINMTSTIIDTSILVILICLVRRIFRDRVSASAIHALWGLVVLRYFAAPIWSAWSALGGTSSQKFSAVNTINSGINAVRGWVVPEQLQRMDGTTPVRVDLFALSLPAWFFVLWIAGVIVVYFWSVYVNEKFRRYLFDNRVTLWELECKYPVYKVPGIISPCVMRVRGKAGIYLTEEVAEDEEKQKYVLMHELCHLEHRDMFWGNIRCILLALNWFNPLVWLAAVLSKRDAEMLCDERAVHKLGEKNRLRYGEVLVGLVADTAVRRNLFFTATTMSCSKKELAQRVRRVADGKRSFWVSGVVVALTVIVACMTSFVTRADLRGLSPEETVQQYMYYWNQNYEKGMTGLRFERPSDYVRQETISILGCRDTTGEDGYDISMDEAERQSGEAFYDVCRLRLYIQRLVVETDDKTKKSEPRRVNSEEEFLLARETEKSDWKIVTSTMDVDTFLSWK